MNIHIVTQTFPPRIGGMQSLMYSIAKGLKTNSRKIFVYPDHYFSSNKFFKVNYFPALKIIRPLIKKILVGSNYNDKDIVICDTWKSVNAVPHNVKKIICFAIGQEFLVSKKNKKIHKIQKALNRCNYIVSITKFTQDLVLSEFSVEPKKLKIVFPTFSVLPPLKKKYEKNNSLLKIISICRIEERKGLHEVAKVMIKNYNQLPNFIWHIVGEGPTKKKLKNFVEESIINKNVIFEGFVSETKKLELLANSDLFVMPGYMVNKSVEGFGIVYTEAASYGVPSIGGIDGGASEAVINNKTGWCVNPKNEEELKKILFEAITNNKLRKQMGKTAKKYYEKKFSSSIAFKHLNLLIKDNY